MTSGLVFVNDVLVGYAINDAGRFLEYFVGSGLVASRDGLAYTLDRGAKHRTKAGIVAITLYRLASAFASLCSVGHGLCFSEFGKVRQFNKFPRDCKCLERQSGADRVSLEPRSLRFPFHR
jgi:hypothetical protein